MFASQCRHVTAVRSTVGRLSCLCSVSFVTLELSCNRVVPFCLYCPLDYCNSLYYNLPITLSACSCRPSTHQFHKSFIFLVACARLSCHIQLFSPRKSWLKLLYRIISLYHIHVLFLCNCPCGGGRHPSARVVSMN